MKKYKTIGILGGMGPESTAEFYLRIIRLFQKEMNAVYDDDFPEIIIINLPLPDVVENKINDEDIKFMLIQCAKKLENAGADFVAIPCNTVSSCIDEMRNELSIPILNIVEETSREINSQNFKRIGLLATEKTIQDKIYSDFLKNVDLIIPEKNDQKTVTKIVLTILSGRRESENIEFLNCLIEYLKSRGAEKVILGCTDLPLLIARDDR